MKKILVFACALGMAGASVEPAAGQSTRADSIADLVEALMTDMLFGEGRPILRLGQLPPSSPDVHLPPGSETLGSIEYPNVSLSIIRSAHPSEVIRRTRAALEESGWLHTPGPSLSGFLLQRAPRYSANLCSDDQHLILGAGEDGDIFVMHSKGELAVVQCTEARGAVSQSPTQPLLPALAPPPGTQPRASSGGGGGDSWYGNIRLTTDLAVADILSHYLAQLQQAGVEIGMRTEEGTVSSAVIRLTDIEGVPWDGVATAVAANQSERVVIIQLVRITQGAQ